MRRIRSILAWTGALTVLLLVPAAGAVPAGEPFRVHPADTNNQRHLHAAGDLLVWADDRDWPGSESHAHDVYVYNLSARGPAERLTSVESSKTFPRVSDGWVVWADDRDGGAPHVYAMDLATRTERRITPTSSAQTSPDLDYPWVVYKDDAPGGGRFDVVAYHLETAERRTLNTLAGTLVQPVIGGELVAWVEVLAVGDQGAVTHSNIIGHDLATGETRRVTTQQAQQSFPDVDGPFIVWQDARAGNQGWDLYAYQWQTRTERVLLRAPAGQEHPQLRYPHLVWRDLRHLHDTQDEGYSLYYQDLSSAAPAVRLTGDARNVQQTPALADRYAAWIEMRPGGGDGAFDVWALQLVADGAPARPTAPASQELTLHPTEQGVEQASGAWFVASVGALAVAAWRRRR